MDLLSPNFRKQLSHSSVFLNIKESFLGTWNIDITPSCTDSYSLLGVTIRKKWSLAQNSWFIDLKLNRNCCNRWESCCSLTHTKRVSSWCFQSQGASVQWLLLNSPAGTWSCTAPLTPSWAELCANLRAGFLPAKLETGSWNGSAIGKTRPLFSHTHPPAECQGTVLEMRKSTWAGWFLQELPKGIWRWGRGMDLAKGGENLQLMWSEWDRLCAGMTADDGVIKYLP